MGRPSATLGWAGADICVDSPVLDCDCVYTVDCSVCLVSGDSTDKALSGVKEASPLCRAQRPDHDRLAVVTSRMGAGRKKSVPGRVPWAAQESAVPRTSISMSGG